MSPNKEIRRCFQVHHAIKNHGKMTFQSILFLHNSNLFSELFQLVIMNSFNLFVSAALYTSYFQKIDIGLFNSYRPYA